MPYFEIINTKFFIIFFIILFLNVVLINYRIKIARYLKIIDLPNKRKIHKEPTPLIGGLGYFLTLLILLFYNISINEINLEKFISLISIYTTVFFFVGLFDDIKTLSAKLRSFLIITSVVILIILTQNLLLQILILNLLTLLKI